MENLISAENDVIKIERSYNETNKLIKEVQGDFVVINEYDLMVIEYLEGHLMEMK